MRKALIIILLLIAACAPPLDVAPVATILNDNPDLALDECNKRAFVTEQWGAEVITQCVPDGFTLYEDNGDSSPIRSVYTGVEYSILPHGSTGAIGYTMPLALTQGCKLIQVYGMAVFEGPLGDWWMESKWHIVNSDIEVKLLPYSILAKGQYKAMFTMDAPQAGLYEIDIYLWLQHASYTADSWFTFKRITIESVLPGFCG